MSNQDRRGKIIKSKAGSVAFPVKNKLLLRSVERSGILTVPPIVQDVLHTPGKALEPGTRSFLEACFGQDFSKVRVHADARAKESAEAINSRAFTVGRDIFFGLGSFNPGTSSGRYLLAHELAHVVQQENAGSAPDIEARANRAASEVAEGRKVTAGQVGGAGYGLFRQSKAGEEESKEKPANKIQNEATLQLSPRQLTETKSPWLPGPTPPKSEPKQPGMPSRIPIPWLSTGRFSLGLRLGFPELRGMTEFQEGLLGGSPDSLKLSLTRATIIDQMLTGKVPTAWEELDKSLIAKAAWGIFSHSIAPDLARKITSGLTLSSAPGGLSYELDLVLITDFKKEGGGGASFTLHW